MTTIADPILAKEMTRQGHVVKTQTKTRMAAAGGYKHSWTDAITGIPALVQDVSGMEVIIRERIGVRATHIIYLPISVDGTDISVTEDHQIVATAPAELNGKVFSIQRVLRTPYAVATETKGRHIEVYALYEKE